MTILRTLPIIAKRRLSEDGLIALLKKSVSYTVEKIA